MSKAFWTPVYAVGFAVGFGLSHCLGIGQVFGFFEGDEGDRMVLRKAFQISHDLALAKRFKEAKPLCVR